MDKNKAYNLKQQKRCTMNWTQTQIKNTDVWKRLFDRKSKRLSFAVLFLAFFVATYSRRKRRLQLCFNKLTTLPQTSIRDQLYLTNLKTIVSKSDFVWCSYFIPICNRSQTVNSNLRYKKMKQEQTTRSTNVSMFVTVQSCFLLIFFCNYNRR